MKAILCAGVALLIGASAFADALEPTAIPTSRTYREVRTFLYELQQRNPQAARVFQLGLSDSGEMIEGLQIGDGSVKSVVVAAHHGNEYGSVEVAKALAADMVANPVVGQTVFVIPVLNTSGYDRRQRWEIANGRTNDPNRDYPGPCGGAGPFNLKSTKALADLLDRESIVTSATLHTFFPAVVWPWGFDTSDLSTPYDGLYEMLARAAVVESQYPVGNSTALIYPANGAYEDYAFWQHGIWSLLFELGETHSPNARHIEDMQRVNVPGIRRFLDQAPRERATDHGFSGGCSKDLIDLHLE
jgi:predicted deacylase